MPGANCSIYDCSISRRNPGVAIFRVTRGKDEYNTEWRKKLVNIITKDRVIDPGLKAQIEKQNLYICEKHFSVELINSSKLGCVAFSSTDSVV